MCGILALISTTKYNSLQFLDFLKYLQHRGQDSCGIAYKDLLDKNFIAHQKANGLVKDFRDTCAVVYSSTFLGHTRYTTSGQRKNNTDSTNMIHPILESFQGNTFAFVFNGNIPNLETKYSCDTEFITDFIKSRENKINFESISNDDAFTKVLIEFINLVDRAYNIIFLYMGKVYIIRDSYGTRPIKIIKKNDGDIFLSSEDYFLESDSISNDDIEPGSITIIDSETLEITQKKIKTSRKAYCVFEYIYFMNEKTLVNNFLVKDTRVKMGNLLAESENIIDTLEKNRSYIVSSIPNTSTVSANVFASTLDVPYSQFIKKNKNVERTFIITDDNERQNYSKEKYIIDGEAIHQKDIILVDDSIVRGTTIKNLVKSIKKHSPKSIHIRVTSPPITHTCSLGIDIPTKKELIYNFYNNPEKLKEYLEVDSVKYLGIDDLKSIFTNKNNMCMGCINGDYNIDKKLEW